MLKICLLLCLNLWLPLAREKSRVERYSVDYSIYHNYSSYVSDLLNLANNPLHSSILRLKRPCNTKLGDPLYVLEITNFESSVILANSSTAPVYPLFF